MHTQHTQCNRLLSLQRVSVREFLHQVLKRTKYDRLHSPDLYTFHSATQTERLWNSQRGALVKK